MLRYIFSVLFLVFTFSMGALFFLFEKNWVDLSILDSKFEGQASVLIDCNGSEITKFNFDKREPVNFNKLPNILVKAFLAAEDRKFFQHSGIDIKGIIRSLLVNIRYGRFVQGASTITQQLVRQFFVSREKNILRKIKEIFLAFQIERELTKEQILEKYLSNIYFGRGIYGVEAACQRFWNKSTIQITLDEAATLAATAKSAFYYSPINSPLNSKRRRNIVLSSMKKLGFISEKDYLDAITKSSDVIDRAPNNSKISYIKEKIRIWSEKKWGRDSLYKNGLKIKTTIDLKKQKLATEIFTEKVKDLHSTIDPQINGGMISIESKTGKIKAFVGGFDFKKSQFNRAFQAVRQVGSAFKPFLYTAALKFGFDMNYTMTDEPIEMEMPGGQVWRPKNWTSRFDGEMTLLKALTLSNNIIAIKLFLELGAQKVINMAKKFQFKQQLKPYPSLALGTAESTVFDLAASFNTFANDGRYVKPYLIDWVKDKWNKKIWNHKTKTKKVLDSITNSKMINALSYRIKRAKYFSKEKSWINAEAIGKTGSTNEASTTWFVGSTPELTTCVYVGRDDNKPLGKNIFANKLVFPIWLDFNKKINFKKTEFYLDPNLKEVTINWNTGKKTRKKNKLNSVIILKENS